MDAVIDTMENRTVEVVEVIGDNVISVIPLITGLCITLCVVLVHRQVVAYWAENKTLKALRDGQNLEGNVADADRPTPPPQPKARPAAVLVDLGNLVPKAAASAPCRCQCGYWATVCTRDLEWIGNR